MFGKSQGRGDAPGCRTVEGGKLLLQRCLAAHGRPGASVHFGDALMEARDLHFARSKGLFQRNLTRERSAEALPSFGSLGEGGCRFFRLLGHFTLPLRMSRSNWLVDLKISASIFAPVELES